MREASFLRASVLMLAVITPSVNAVVIDFDLDGVGNPLSAGAVIDNEFAAVGLHVSADNFAAGHPDLAIIFDSASPTGGDTDLATPGYHPSNTIPYGNVLILAENAGDANLNGLIDVPDDEGSNPAGFIRFDLDFTAEQADLVLVDIEEAGGSIVFFLDAAPLGSIPIPATQDNAVSSLTFSAAQFDAFRVNLAGSGAIARIDITPSENIPEPATLAFMAAGSLACFLSRRRGT